MPWKRKITHETEDGETTTSHVYYINRKLPGLGPEPVCKSLGTSRKRLAQQRERAILRLAERGESDIVRAFLDDRLSIGTIQGEFEQGRVDRLNKLLDRPDESVADAIDEALAVKRGEVEGEDTIDGYRGKLELFAEWLEEHEFGLDKNERNLDRPGEVLNVRDAFEKKRPKKYLGYRRDLPGANNTVNNDRIALSVLARHCVDVGWIEEMPDFRWKKRPVRIRWLEPKQIRAYLAEFDREETLLHSILLGAGLRLSEAHDMLKADIQLDHEGRGMIRQSKTASGVRAVYLPEWVSSLLGSHIQDRDLEAMDPIFTTPTRTIQKHHREVCDRLGISGREKVVDGNDSEEEGGPRNANYTIHDHRHTAAVALARAGIPLNFLQKQLGHDNIEQTMRYADFHPAYREVEPFYERVADKWGVESVVFPTTDVGCDA